jgi:alpha-ketoglutarate-dependent taurine dioxygenase
VSTTAPGSLKGFPLGNIRRQIATLPERAPIETSALAAGQTLPLVVQPPGAHASNSAELDLAEWAAASGDFLAASLQRHGAILFRGFAINSARRFERVARATCRELYDENSEHVPVGDSDFVQTPVFYAPDQKLLWHNENSFNLSWPRKILFCCHTPAASGGETPIVDSRQVHAALDPDVRRPFAERGVMYVRNYSAELGLDWRAVFRTESRAEVEERCQANDMSFEWKPGDLLRTRAVRPAVVAHPESGELSWFNQAQHWHVSCLDAATRHALRSLFAEEDLPRNCYYGDGSPIPDAAMAHILDVYARLEVSFPWQRGDVLLVDNLLTAHARNPFTGERKILVALGEMTRFA